MEKDRYKGGIIFKWLNQKEIYAKYNGKGRKYNLQAHIDKLHQDYIATRVGVDFGESTHGLFGYMYDTPEVEMLDLETIKARVGEMSKKNIDIYKTVISLKENDAVQYNMMSKKAWKDLLEKNILEIANQFKIPIENLEWTASFHNKKENPHCHLLLWNKEQNLEVKRKPFINYKAIRKIIAKEVYKEELKVLYDIKNISKKELENLSKDEINKYKEEVKNIYNNEDLMFNIVNTENAELYVNNVIKNMGINDKIYISSKSAPENYVEIYKINNEEYEFKNIGPKAILYKDKSYLETVQFLTNFEDLCIFDNKENLEEYKKSKQQETINIENELKEIIPTVFNIPIISVEINEEYLDAIIKKIIELEKVSNKYKKGFKYQYQTPMTKQVLDEISMLLLNVSNACKSEVENYIEICVNIDKVMQQIDNYEDYSKSRDKANKFVMNKIGNQILKFVKEMKTEEYERKKEEWKTKKEYWNKKNQKLQEKQVQFETRQELYEKQWQKINIQNIIKDTFIMLAQENLVQTSKYKRITKTFGDLSKREIIELVKKNKNKGFEWYENT